MTKCPHCKNQILNIVTDVLPVTAGPDSWRGVSYNCPSCQTSLGVVIDQVALKSELRNEILSALGKR